MSSSDEETERFHRKIKKARLIRKNNENLYVPLTQPKSHVSITHLLISSTISLLKYIVLSGMVSVTIFLIVKLVLDKQQEQILKEEKQKQEDQTLANNHAAALDKANRRDVAEKIIWIHMFLILGFGGTWVFSKDVPFGHKPTMTQNAMNKIKSDWVEKTFHLFSVILCIMVFIGDAIGLYDPYDSNSGPWKNVLYTFAILELLLIFYDYAVLNIDKMNSDLKEELKKELRLISEKVNIDTVNNMKEEVLFGPVNEDGKGPEDPEDVVVQLKKKYNNLKTELTKFTGQNTPTVFTKAVAYCISANKMKYHLANLHSELDDHKINLEPPTMTVSETLITTVTGRAP